jgi:Spy/CpxP family protein refolding chaperone
MHRTFERLAAVSLFCVMSTHGNAAQQTRPVAATAPASVDELLVAVRDDLQGNRSDVMAKNLTLSAAQAAKFWPVYEAYQKRQNVIMDDHLKGVQRFIENFESLDDAGALALIKAHLDRDAQMAVLRQKALPEFQAAIGTKMAVRAMQIDRRLSLAYQMQILSKIPLAH